MADFFRKLFGKKEEPETVKQIDMATTAPLSDQQISSIMGFQNLKSETKQLVASVGQSVGKQRDHNEDSVLALTSTISGSTDSIPFGLYIVADGMGGHQFGEVASNAAVRLMGGNITKKFHSYLYNLPTQSLQESLQEVMESSINEAHQYVQRDVAGHDVLGLREAVGIGGVLGRDEAEDAAILVHHDGDAVPDLADQVDAPRRVHAVVDDVVREHAVVADQHARAIRRVERGAEQADLAHRAGDRRDQDQITDLERTQYHQEHAGGEIREQAGPGDADGHAAGGHQCRKARRLDAEETEDAEEQRDLERHPRKRLRIARKRCVDRLRLHRAPECREHAADHPAAYHPDHDGGEKAQPCGHQGLPPQFVPVDCGPGHRGVIPRVHPRL